MFAGVLNKLPEGKLIFLDSNQLTALPRLLESVSASANYVLLLSRQVLRRPWVLAELTRAHAMGRALSTVLVEFPGRGDDPKAFRFPQDLDSAIAEWTMFVERDFAKKDDSIKRRLSENLSVFRSPVLSRSPSSRAEVMPLPQLRRMCESAPNLRHSTTTSSSTIDLHASTHLSDPHGSEMAIDIGPETGSKRQRMVQWLPRVSRLSRNSRSSGADIDADGKQRHSRLSGADIEIGGKHRVDP